MTSEAWGHQKMRLRDHFGVKSLSNELSLLISVECKNMADRDLVEMVNVFIGSRRSNNPPTLVDFREGRLRFERLSFERDVNGAAVALDRPWQIGLKTFLEKEFRGCKTINEAVEVKRLQNLLTEAELKNKV